MHRLFIVAQCAQEHFSEILSEAPIIFSDKVRLVCDMRGGDGVLTGRGERIVKGAGAAVFRQDKICICKCL